MVIPAPTLDDMIRLRDELRHADAERSQRQLALELADEIRAIALSVAMAPLQFCSTEERLALCFPSIRSISTEFASNHPTQIYDYSLN